MRQQLPDMEFGRRMAVERELEKVDGIRLTNIIFDETGHFVLYGTMLGIKVINVETNRYVRMKTERKCDSVCSSCIVNVFMSVTLGTIKIYSRKCMKPMTKMITHSVSAKKVMFYPVFVTYWSDSGMYVDR